MSFFKTIDITRKDLNFDRPEEHFWLTLWPKTDDKSLFCQKAFLDTFINRNRLISYFDQYGKGVPTLLSLLDDAHDNRTKIKAILGIAGIGQLRLSRIGSDAIESLESEAGISTHTFCKTKNNLPETDVIQEIGAML